MAVGSGDGHMIVLAEDSGAHVTTVRRTLYYTVQGVYIVMVSVVRR